VKPIKLFNNMNLKEQIEHIRKCQANGIIEIRNGSDSCLADIADHLDIWGPWLCDKVEEQQKKLEIAREALEFYADYSNHTKKFTIISDPRLPRNTEVGFDKGMNAIHALKELEGK